MRLTSFEVQRYGPFERQRLEFDPRPGCLNLVVAPNGAGKTVLLRAICDLLFGIPARTPMDFRHGYANMRLLAEAVDAAGAPFRFGRRKGQGNTLIDAAGAELPREALARALGPVDQPMLERLFVLGTERLRQGGEELLQSGGALGEALQAAAGGLRDAHRVKDWLAEERDRAAPLRRSQTRPFYKGLDALQQAQRTLRQEIWKPEDWLAQEKAAAEAERRRRDAREAARVAGETIKRLERIRRARPHLAAAEAARAWLAGNHEAPLLDPGLAARFQAARDVLVLAEARVETAERQHRGVSEQLSTATPDAPLLAEAEPITRLAEELGGAERAAAALPRLEAAALEATDRIRRLLRQIGSDLPPEAAERLLPATADVLAARQLIGAAAAVAQAVEAASARRELARRRLEEARAALAEAPEAAAEAGLQRLLREVREGGEPVAALAAAQSAAVLAEAALARALAGAAPWPGSAEALRALAVPSLPAFERLAAALDTAEAQREAAAAASTAAAAAAAATARRLRDLLARAELPSEAALPEARRHRDAGWRLIQRLAFTATPPTPAQVAAFAGPDSLDLAFDRALQAADALADRFAAEATRLGEADAIRAELAAAECRQAAAGAKRQAAEAAAAAARAAWEAAGRPLGLDAGASLADLRALLTARERVVAALEALAQARATHAALEQRQQGWAARLAAALGQGPAPLAVLLDTAEARLDAAQLRATERARREAAVAAAAQQRTEAELAAQEAARRAEMWSADWAAALARLGRPAGEAPEQTQVVLELLERLAAAAQEAAAATAEARTSRLLAEGFAAEAAALLRRLTPGSPELDPHAALRSLRDRLAPAQRAAARQALLHRQREEAATALAEAVAARDAAEAGWRAVLATLGATDAAAAEARLELGQRRRAEEAALARALAALREAGDGLAEPALASEAASVPAEALPAAHEAARQDAAAAQDTAEQAAGELERLRQAIRQREAAVTAMEAKADEQAAVALLGRTLEEALVLQLAGSLLGKALEAVEAVDSPLLLQRITAVYRRLTGGAIERVVTEDGEGGQVRLAVIEPPDRLAKPVAALSEGSRDQLFLALRVIAIEDHVAAAPPLPFIGDDILQSFDDDRAMAAFEMLLELSRQVQVILLTHHEHLVALAGRLPPGSVAVQRLARGAQATALTG